MNKYRFCPECGAKVPVDAQFCPNCGHRFDINLTTANDRSDSSEVQNSQSYDNRRDPTNNVIHDDNAHSDNSAMNNDDNQRIRPPHHGGKGKWWALIIVLIIIAAGGGALGYKYLMAPKANHAKVQSSQSSNSVSSSSNASNSSSSESDSSESSSDQTDDLTSSEAQGIVSDTFSAVGQSVSDDDDTSNYSDSFINGEANSSYQDLASWAHLQSKNSNVNGVDINVEDFKLNGNKGTFKATYDFDQQSDHHIQVYVWNVTFQKQNDKWLILSCKSDNKPVADYDR